MTEHKAANEVSKEKEKNEAPCPVQNITLYNMKVDGVPNFYIKKIINPLV